MKKSSSEAQKEEWSASGKKVILVTYPDEFVKNEAIGLAEAANYSIAEIVSQKRLNHQQYGVGPGKAEELRLIAENKKTEMIVVDERLSSGQAHNLAKFCHQEVIDRERLILDIFNSRATTTEAKLQVKLAELKYEIPRAREAVRISLKGEQAGFMGMGEYAVDIKFRALKKQMNLIQKKLESARRQRQLFKVSRERLKLPYVSLAGYTSSGKTTLFNRFVSETKQESPNLFTTLTTTTRSFEPVPGRKVLLSDTVGFISRLPTYMVEAFKSTLEELTYADLILLMADSSEPLDVLRVKYHACRQVMDQLHINPIKILMVLNKVDLVPKDALPEITEVFRDLPTTSISAKTGEGTRKLRLIIFNKIFEGEEKLSEDDSRKIIAGGTVGSVNPATENDRLTGPLI
ncbi:MAG: GTPase HflX [Thaumarchaeota archaeon]|nr:GTPase HflX [Nitrososphaerota archaeon]